MTSWSALFDEDRRAQRSDEADGVAHPVVRDRPCYRSDSRIGDGTEPARRRRPTVTAPGGRSGGTPWRDLYGRRGTCPSSATRGALHFAAFPRVETVKQCVAKLKTGYRYSASSPGDRLAGGHLRLSLRRLLE